MDQFAVEGKPFTLRLFVKLRFYVPPPIDFVPYVPVVAMANFITLLGLIFGLSFSCFSHFLRVVSCASTGKGGLGNKNG
jgi:hypothetical protein